MRKVYQHTSGECLGFGVGVFTQFPKETVYAALGPFVEKCKDGGDFGSGGAGAFGFVSKDDARPQVSDCEGVEFGGHVHEATEEQLAFLQGGAVPDHGVEESPREALRGALDVCEGSPGTGADAGGHGERVREL